MQFHFDMNTLSNSCIDCMYNEFFSIFIYKDKTICDNQNVVMHS